MVRFDARALTASAVGVLAPLVLLLGLFLPAVPAGAQELASVDPGRTGPEGSAATRSTPRDEVDPPASSVPWLASIRRELEVVPEDLAYELTDDDELRTCCRVDDPASADYYELEGFWEFVSSRVERAVKKPLRDDRDRVVRTLADGTPFGSARYHEHLRGIERSRSPRWAMEWPDYVVGRERPLRTATLGERSTIIRLGPLTMDNEMKVRLFRGSIVVSRSEDEDDTRREESSSPRPTERGSWFTCKGRLEYSPRGSIEYLGTGWWQGLIRRYGAELEIELFGDRGRSHLATVVLEYEGRGRWEHALSASLVLAAY